MSGQTMMVAWKLAGKTVLVVGGGGVAQGRIRLALDAGATVRVVAIRLHPRVAEDVALGLVTWVAKTFDPAQLDDVDMVLSAVDDPELTQAVVVAGQAARVPLNVADVPDLCDFWFPSTHREGDIHIAVSTEGRGPALAARLKRRLVDALPARAALAVRRFGVFRRKLRISEDVSAVRMAHASAVSRAPWSTLAHADERDLEAWVEQRWSQPQARIQLVGAGPGDPEYLTQAAREAIGEADIVFSDRLVPPDILALVRGELRVARKFPGRADAAQQELNEGVLAAARRGEHVVRLKCGDPFVFGRGLEEVQFLRTHGFEAEVIPGVSSALTAPMSVGIPVTARGYADSVMVLTGHGAAGRPVVLPEFQPNTTLVWLMAMGNLERIVAGMISEHFYPCNWPCAVIQQASHAEQRAVRGPLHAIAALCREHGLSAPAVVVMGTTVSQAASDAFDVDLHVPQEVSIAS